MKGNSILQFDKTATVHLAIIVPLMLFTYVLSYRPYITEWYLPVNVRIATEAILLFLLIIVSLSQRSIRTELLWLISFIMLYCCLLLLGFHSFVKMISFFNKIAILILLIDFLTRYSGALKFSLKLWIGLSYILCILAMLSFIVYSTGIITFSYQPHQENLFHPVFGNILPRSKFGIVIGTVVGYMIEGVYFSFLLGFNIIMSKTLIGNVIKRKKFIIVNLVAGLVTFSTTFYIFFIIYFIFDNSKILIKKNPLALQMLMFLLSVIIFITIYSNFFYYTSATIRIDRMVIYLEEFKNSTFIYKIFGTGVSTFNKKYQFGIDSGWMRLLIERGLVLLVYVLALLYRYTKFNHWLMFYILYYNFSIPLFSFPLFYLLIALSYACYYKNKRLYTAV